MIFKALNRHPLIATTRIELEKGAHVFAQSEASRGVYCVLEGAIDLIRCGRDGENIRLHFAKEGQGFAEASLFSDVYHCDAVATKESVIVCYNKNSLLNAFKVDHGLMVQYLAHLAQMVQAERVKAELRSIRSAKTRVLTFFQLDKSSLSVMEMAAELSLTHEACYRALRSLCDEKRIRKIARGKYELATRS